MIPDQARLRRLDEVVRVVVARYRMLGRTEQECLELEAFYRCPHLTEWMEFADAQMIVMDTALSPEAARIRYSDDEIKNANRTSVTATRHERVQLVSDRLGISYAQAQRKVDGLDHEPAAQEGDALLPCAVYRHFDVDDQLLYVGIANAPELRRSQHEASSRWYRFATRMDVEWFPSRGAAAQAERRAIKDELPVFNKTHGGVERSERVVAYCVAHGATDMLAPVV